MRKFADVFANEYISGEGIRFFEPGDGEHSFQSHWTQQTIGTKECDRSLLAFATTMKTAEIKALPCAIDLLGDFPDQVRANISSTQTVKESKDIVKELKLAQLRPMREAESTTYLKNMMVRSLPLSPVVLLVLCVQVCSPFIFTFLFSHDRR